MKPHDRLARHDREIWRRETQDLKPLRGGRRRDAAGIERTATPGRPDPAQDEAWIEFTRDVAPLRSREAGERSGCVPGETTESDSATIPPTEYQHRSGPERRSAPGTYSLDRRTEDRLRRGRIEPESRLDLHGMRYVVAKQAVARFLEQKHIQGQRLVLVITGRGNPKLARSAGSDDIFSDPDRPEPGVLRRDFPRWIREGSLTNIVIRCQPAHASHGGPGAFYVYLKKRK